MAGTNVDLDSKFPSTHPSSPNLSKALILHPVHSNYTHAHLEYNPLTLLDSILLSEDRALSLNDILACLSINMEAALME
jgi:hypothetical protein